MSWIGKVLGEVRALRWRAKRAMGLHKAKGEPYAEEHPELSWPLEPPPQLPAESCEQHGCGWSSEPQH